MKNKTCYCVFVIPSCEKSDNTIFLGIYTSHEKASKALHKAEKKYKGLLPWVGIMELYTNPDELTYL